MTFLDEQGVKPCGHSARDKGILIGVYASCLSHQVPRQLAFSVYARENDKNTAFLSSISCSFITLSSKIADAQHVIGMDFTSIRCGRYFIAEECLCLPQANWQTWSAQQRVKAVAGMNRGWKFWYTVLVVDNDETILSFLKSENIECIEKYGEILKSGWGEYASEEVKEFVWQKFPLYREDNNTG